MLVAPEATVRLTTLPQRCRPKAPKTRPAPKKPNLKIQSQPHHMTMRRNYLRRTTEKIRRRSSGVKSGNTLGSGKSRLRPPTSTPPISRRKRKRGVMLVKSRISIVIRKAILLATAPSQKTSISLGNLRASDWWWWGGCQDALHLVPGPIPGRTDKSPAR